MYPRVDLNPQKFIRLMLQKSISEKQKKVMNPKCYKNWLFTVAASSLFWTQKRSLKHKLKDFSLFSADPTMYINSNFKLVFPMTEIFKTALTHQSAQK